MTPIDPNWISKNIKKFYKKKVVIITGAGISVASGIPDFRSKTGIFSDIKKKYKVNGPDLFSYKFGIEEKTRKNYLKYISKLKQLVNDSKPTYTHLFFKYFLGRSKKLRVYTQNIDNLEIKAGLECVEDIKTTLVQLHGDLKYLRCINCGTKEEFKEEFRRSFEKEIEVKCKNCKENRRKTSNVLHTNIIHYYQDHPYSELISTCIQNDTNCNLLIVVGTRLDVFGVENMVKYFKASNKNITSIFINPEEPKKKIEKHFGFHFKGKSDDFFRILKNEIEKYRIFRRVKRLSLCKEEEYDKSIQVGPKEEITTKDSTIEEITTKDSTIEEITTKDSTIEEITTKDSTIEESKSEIACDKEPREEMTTKKTMLKEPRIEMTTKKTILRESKKDTNSNTCLPTLKRLSLTIQDIQSSFLTFDKSIYSPSKKHKNEL